MRHPPSSLRSAGPPRLTSRPPEGGCYAARIHVWVCRSETRFVFCNVPPSRLRSAGPPRLDAATPGGGLLRCPNPRLGSLFAAQNHPRPEREPQKPRKRLITATLWGARRESRGFDRARSARRGDVAKHKRSLMQPLLGDARKTQETKKPAFKAGFFKSSERHSASIEYKPAERPGGKYVLAVPRNTYNSNHLLPVRQQVF